MFFSYPPFSGSFFVSLFIPLEYCPPQNFTSDLILHLHCTFAADKLTGFVRYVKALYLCSRQEFGAILLFILYAELLFATVPHMPLLGNPTGYSLRV